MLTPRQLHALQFTLGELKRMHALLGQVHAGVAGIEEVIHNSALPITPVVIDFTQTRELLYFLHDQLQREHYAQLFPNAYAKFSPDELSEARAA